MSTEAQPIDADLARRVKLVIFDVDGVLTDAGVYIGATASGETTELKRFDIQDGVGLKMLMWSGLEVAIVSGRVSEATVLRARELEVLECHQDPNAHKLGIVEELLRRKALQWSEVAMLADDIPDLAVLRCVGLKAAVPTPPPMWWTSVTGSRAGPGGTAPLGNSATRCSRRAAPRWGLHRTRWGC